MIWVVGQHVWRKEYPSVYESLKKDWSETVKPIMTALSGKSKEHATFSF